MCIDSLFCVLSWRLLGGFFHQGSRPMANLGRVQGGWHPGPGFGKCHGFSQCAVLLPLEEQITTRSYSYSPLLCGPHLVGLAVHTVSLQTEAGLLSQVVMEWHTSCRPWCALIGCAATLLLWEGGGFRAPLKGAAVLVSLLPICGPRKRALAR